VVPERARVAVEGLTETMIAAELLWQAEATPAKSKIRAA